MIVPPRHLSPSLADDVALLRAPTQLWSSPDGAVDASGGRGRVHGLHHADWRYLSVLSWDASGEHLDLLSAHHGSDTARYTWALRGLDDETKDPRLLVQLRRTVTAGGLHDEVRVENATARAVPLTLTVSAVLEAAPLSTVRAGNPARTRLDVVEHASTLRLLSARRSLTLRAPGATTSVADADDDRHLFAATWRLEVAARDSIRCDLEIEVTDPDAVVRTGSPGLAPPAPTGDRDLDSWLSTAVADLNALALSLTGQGAGSFLAAGAPWYLTLFGRDSLWSALLLLPEGLGLAEGTLRTLARHQSTVRDSLASAEPGKILHELRADAHEVPREGLHFPAAYFGSVDSTLLWMRLLHDAWRAGLSDHSVLELLPALRAAVGWMLTDADADDDGLVEYHDASGRGLANQGWKDSSDAIRFHDGTIARGPVALVEVQGYAYEAATSAIAILDAFATRADASEARRRDAELVARVRTFRDRLASEFHARFWVEVEGRRYPALALDRDGRAADSLTSNIGHLLGTGLLDAEQERAVADLLRAPDMRSGLGLRTLSTTCAGYWPLSYHCGSVWAHDTAITVSNLLRVGLAEPAAELARELVEAAVALGYRMPELYGGQSAADHPDPVRYPTSCSPQAWSAAAAFPVREALLRSR